ncbi:MAG TPA: 1-acyl-sn-glycerol-3-phosphate acyltransferase [Ornithinibacter sp.]|nr:1-acyl-sn-glycerol-3-phosphate acyltransferase [Ornithinibacter sp.]
MGARSIPPPPLPVRRVLHVIWPLVGVVVTGLMAPVVVAGAFMVLVDRRARLFRAASLAVILMWVDIRMLVGCWALWARSPDHSSPTWREDHERLFVQALDSLMYYARRWVNLEVRLADRMHFGSDAEPLLALARHAGPADSLAIAWLLSRTAGRLPRIVLAEALRWDPGIDTILTRLQSFFVPSGTGGGEDRIGGLTRMAESMDDGDVFVIFPEGQNWTPGRRAGIIRRLRERGELARARRAEELRNVLPPKTRGAWAARAARPGADVMVLAHVGLARLSTPQMVWEALPFTDRPLLVKTWTYAAADVPLEAEAFAAWLDARWGEVDAWVEANAAPYLPGHEPSDTTIRIRSDRETP